MSNKNIELNENINKFQEFMNNHKVTEKGCYHTHTLLGPPYGKFLIEDESLDEFMNLYCQLVGKTNLYVVERPKDIGPLMIDIDMRFTEEYNERQYTYNDIAVVIEKLISVMKKYYKLKQKNVTAYIFEKNKPSKDAKNKQYKDGFHIIFPNLPMTKEMRYVVIEKAKEEIITGKYYDHLKFINNFEKDVFDTSVVESNGMMMYGSKKYGGQIYKLTHIKKNNEEVQLVSKCDHQKIARIVSNRKFSDDCEQVVYKVDESTINNIIEEVLTKIGKNKKNKKKEKKDTESDYLLDDDYFDFGNNVKDKNMKKKYENDSSKEIQTAKKIAKILSKERAENYGDWIAVGWALHNISPTLLNSFKQFSRKSPHKYDEAECDKVWNSARNDGYSSASLHLWGREDNLEEYKKIMKENVNELIIKAETGTEKHVADVVYELWKYEFKCSSIKNNEWFHFENHRWNSIECGYKLNQKISNDLALEFTKLHYNYMTAMIGAEGLDQETNNLKAKNLMKLITKLNTHAFKVKVMAECCMLFYDKKFTELLDSKRNLIGFEDGVYDLLENRFRDGLPDDYLTLSVGYNYPKHLHVEHPHVKWVEEFLSQVQTSDEINMYLKILLSSYLDGYTKSEQFVIWTGTGSNGKSKTMELFQNSFGNYCGILPTTLLTQKRISAGSANPELAKLAGKRFAAFQEPEEGETLYVGQMKELTGGDKITARGLYKDPVDFKPQFKLLLVCNILPNIPAQDDGTWRRLRVTPWESKFVDTKNGLYNGKPLKPNQFKKDRSLTEKLEKYAPALMWLLLNVYYPIYQKSNYDISKFEPNKVKQYTIDYQKKNDFYLEFLEEHYISTGDKKDKDSLTNIYTTLRFWIRETQNGVRCPSKKELKQYLINKKYICKGNNIHGLKYVDREEESDNDDEF